jgi:D-alanyl-D-alanine dipeptidase
MIPQPSMADMDRSCIRIRLAAQTADMGCGFDRLAELARNVTGQVPDKPNGRRRPRGTVR